MAGVQIPTLKNDINVAPEAPAPRLNVDVPNAAPGVAAQGRSLEELGGSIVKLEEKLEHDNAVTTGRDAANSIQDAHNRIIYGDPKTKTIGLKYKDGNPQDLWKDYDSQMKDVYDKVTQKEGYSSYTRDMVEKLSQAKYNQVHEDRLQVQGYMQARYEKDIHKSGIINEQTGMIGSTRFLRSDDPNSTAGVDSNIANIQQQSLEYGLKMGTVVPAKEGEQGAMMMTDIGSGQKIWVRPTIPARAEMNQDIGDGLHDAIQNLINEGSTESLANAKMMQEKYGVYLASSAKKDISDKLEQKEIRNEAYGLAFEAKGKSPEQVSAILSKASSPEVYARALGFANANDAHIKGLQQRSYRANYNDSFGLVDSMQKGPTPFTSVVQMQETLNKVRPGLWDKLDAKSKQSLEQMVEAPKVTTDAARARIMNFFGGRDPQHPLDKTDWSDFSKMLIGASPGDRRTYTSWYQASVKPETGPQEVARFRSLDKALTDSLAGFGYVKKNQFGQIDKYDPNLLSSIDQFHKEMANIPGPMDQKTRDDNVRKWTLHVITGAAFQPVGPTKFAQPPPTINQKSTTTDDKGAALVKGKTMIGWRDQFKKDNPNVTIEYGPNGNLEKYIRNQP